MQCVRDTMGIPGRHWLYQNKKMFKDLAEWLPEFHRTGAKLFTIAGPVLVYGVGSSVLYGLLLVLLGQA